MSKFYFSAERLVDAPADVVYRCIADYQHHHRPGGFLPPAYYRDLQVTRGGVGAGTVFRLSMTVGGRTRTVTQEVSEPEPGRVLVESDDRLRTVFTVEPVGEGCRVRFDTVMEVGGIEGMLTHLFGARLLRPVYAEELRHLEDYARALAPRIAG